MATRKKSPPPKIRRVGIAAKPDPALASRVLRDLLEWLEAHQIESVLDEFAASLMDDASAGVSRPELALSGVDLIVVLGGDGTLLGMAREASPQGIPLLGVNLGGLGFMTEVGVRDLSGSLEAVVEGRYTTQARMMLQAKLMREGEELCRYLCLNDVVINKGALSRVLDMNIRIDGRYITTYKADGLILSTPTGSTAYSLSAGGPLIYPEVSALLITPICPHTLSNRPLVVAPTAVIEVALERFSEKVFITVDGQVGQPLQAFDRIEIRRSRHRTQLVRVAGESTFFDVLRRKLKWGQR